MVDRRLTLECHQAQDPDTWESRARDGRYHGVRHGCWVAGLSVIQQQLLTFVVCLALALRNTTLSAQVLVLWFLCNHGRHRSIAMATLLEEVIRRCLRCEVVVTDLDFRPCQYSCGDCTNPRPYSAEVAAMAKLVEFRLRGEGLWGGQKLGSSFVAAYPSRERKTRN